MRADTGSTLYRARSRISYFSVTASALLALTLVGFGDNLFTNVGQPSNFDPKFIVHGLTSLAWMVLLVVQSLLIGAGNLRFHRKLGFAGLIIAVGVTLSTLYLFVILWKGWDHMGAEARANRLLLPAYALLVGLAFANRHHPALHKRLILLGSFCMLGPVLARTFDPLLVPFIEGWPESAIEATFWPYFIGVWSAFFASLLAYDMSTLRRPAAVTLGGTALFAASWLIAIGT